MPCWGSGLVPGQDANVPANLPAFAWLPAIPPQITFEDGKEAHRLPELRLTVEGKKLPTKGRSTAYPISAPPHVVEMVSQLKAGMRIEAQENRLCPYGPKGTPASIQIGPAAPLPNSLGTLRMTQNTVDTLQVASRLGSCATQITANIVDVKLDPSTEAKPWMDALIFQTLVDDKPFVGTASLGEGPPFGASWLGRGQDRLYMDCNPQSAGVPGVQSGSRTIRLQARIPGTDTLLKSEPLTVAFKCPNREEPTPSTDEVATTTRSGWCGGAGSAFIVLPWLFRRKRRIV